MNKQITVLIKCYIQIRYQSEKDYMSFGCEEADHDKKRENSDTIHCLYIFTQAQVEYAFYIHPLIYIFLQDYGEMFLLTYNISSCCQYHG